MVSTAQVQTQPAATQLRRRRRLRRLSRRDKLVAALMLGIPLLLDLAFIWLPAVASVLLSCTKWTGVGGIHLKACSSAATLPGIPQPGCLFGVQNYRQAFTVYPDFWPAVRHNAIWLLVFILLATPLGMLFAVILDRGIRGSRIYQSVLFLPVMLSLALIGIIWELIYSPNYGLINTIIGRNSNTNLIDWLGNPKLNLWAILVEACWRQAGYVMVLYLAGLKSVDPALRESAVVDGANAWQTFWRVVFPVLRPINVVILVVTVIESLRAFDLVYITGKGNPVHGLELLSVLVTQNIVGETQRIGFGSTLGVVVSFQLGFCVFVLSNYMKTIPLDIDEAAIVDGATLWMRFWRITLPLCRPALAAMATLLTTWIYNDFFWAITLISTGSKRPITSALANLQGQFVANQNMIAAAALMAAIPTLVVYLLLQRHFVAGLTLGASKG